MTPGVKDRSELEKLSVNEIQKENVENTGNNGNTTPRYRVILEPVLIGSIMAINLGQTSLQNFYLKTACTVDLNLSSEICHKGIGEEFHVAETASQAVVAGVNISRSFVGAMLSTIVLLFVGPWSDCSGRRKPLVVMSLVGMNMMIIALLLLITFPGANTMQVLYAVQIPMSLGGNFGLLMAASFSHIGDVCHAEGRDVSRTMGTHRATTQIAHVLGAISGPVLYRFFGFYGVFPICLLLQFSSLVFVIFYMKDVNINKENTVSIFNWRLPINAFNCLLKKRDGYSRTIILLMIFTALGDRMVLSSEVLIMFMYYRVKFDFDDIMFGSFLAYRNVKSFIGTLLILTVLMRRLRLSEAAVGALSCVSYMLSTSGLIFVTQVTFVFLLPIIGLISQGTQVVQRPIIDKHIIPSEQGKIYSVLGAMEAATQVVCMPLYSLLYSKTVSTMPDAWLVPGLVIAVLQMLAFLTTRNLQNTLKDPVDVEKVDPVKNNQEELSLTYFSSRDHIEVVN